MRAFLEKRSPKVRGMFEDLLNSKSLSKSFLKQITRSCINIYSSKISEELKLELCNEVISQDYSALSPRNSKDIRTFSDELLSAIQQLVLD